MTLLDMNVISSDAFWHWEKSPDNIRGKGTAVLSVRQFLTILAESTNDDSDEEAT